MIRLRDGRRIVNSLDPNASGKDSQGAHVCDVGHSLMYARLSDNEDSLLPGPFHSVSSSLTGPEQRFLPRSMHG